MTVYTVNRSTGSSSAVAQASPAAYSSSNTKRPSASTHSLAGEQSKPSSKANEAERNGSEESGTAAAAAAAAAESDDDEDGQEHDEDEDEVEKPGSSVAGPSKRRRGSAFSSRPTSLPKKKKKKKVLTPGIVYISRVPPGMTPQKVRHLMARWGEVGKVYAQAKDAPTGFNPNQAQKQKKKRHQAANFTEAWVEFLDKNIAKTVANMLNAGVIGGKKGDRWRDDIWTMKYLSGFRWEMLGEQVAYERQAHQARLRTEIARSKTEQSEYLRNVEVARVLRKRAAKKAEQAGAEGAPPAAAASSKQSSTANNGEPPRERFRQRPKAAHQGLEAKGMETVLSNVFG